MIINHLGVNFVTRNLAKATNPTVDVSVNGDTYTIKTVSSVKTTQITFQLGIEFEEDRADGKKVKTIINADGPNKLVQVQKGEKEVTIVREFTDNGLIVVSIFYGVVIVLLIININAIFFCTFFSHTP